MAKSLAHSNPEFCIVSTFPRLCSLQATSKSIISHRKPEICVPCVLGRGSLCVALSEDRGLRGLCEVSAASMSLSQSWCHIFTHNLSRRWVFLYITCRSSSSNQSRALSDSETCLSAVHTAVL